MNTPFWASLKAKMAKVKKRITKTFTSNKGHTGGKRKISQASSGSIHVVQGVPVVTDFVAVSQGANESQLQTSTDAKQAGGRVIPTATAWVQDVGQPCTSAKASFAQDKGGVISTPVPATPIKRKGPAYVGHEEESPATKISKRAHVVSMQTERMRSITDQLENRRIQAAGDKLKQAQERLQCEEKKLEKQLEKGIRESVISSTEARTIKEQASSIKSNLEGFGITESTPNVSATTGGDVKPLKATPTGVVELAMGSPRLSQSGFFAANSSCITYVGPPQHQDPNALPPYV